MGCFNKELDWLKFSVNKIEVSFKIEIGLKKHIKNLHGVEVYDGSLLHLK